MAAKKHVLGFVDPGSKIVRPPLVGMQFLYEGAMSARDVLRAGSRLQAKDLISLLFGHFAAARRASGAPRTRIVLRVFTPAGLPAIKIRCE